MKKEEQNLSRRELRAKILEQRQAEHMSAGDFSRGRAISGYQKEKSERVKNRKLIIRRRKITAFFVSLAVISLAIISLLLQFVAKISVVNADGGGFSGSDKYAQIIDEYYQAQPTERLVGLLNKAELTKQIQAKFPEVESISDIKFSKPTDYRFALKFRQPVASWAVADKTLYVDSEGVAFDNNLFANPTLTISDESGVSSRAGKTVASSAFLKFVGKAVAAAKNNGLEITEVKIPPFSLRQIEVEVASVDYYAKMLTSESPEGQVANFKKAINYFSQRGLKPEYVDLRVEGRGYYK